MILIKKVATFAFIILVECFDSKCWNRTKEITKHF